MSGLATSRPFCKILKLDLMHRTNPSIPSCWFPWQLLCISWLFGNAALAAGRTNLNWHWSSPLPFGNNIAEIIGDTNRYYLAVADHGQAYHSEDLVNWSTLPTGTRRYLRAAVFHPLDASTNTAVIVGEAGTVLRLDEFQQISSTTLPTTDWLEGVATSGSRLVAVGDNAAIYTSEEGTNWLRQTAGVSTWLRSVTWRGTGASGLFVAVGEGGMILTSPNGLTWNRRTSGISADLNRVVATPTGFIAVGNSGAVLISTDGQRWNASNSGATDDLFAAAVESRKVLNQTITVPLVGGARELHSALSLGSGFLWTDELDTRRPAPAPYSSYYSALHDGTRYVVAGQAGIIVTGQRGTTGDPSLQWTALDSPPRVILRDVTTAAAIGTNISATLVDGLVQLTPSRFTNQIYAAAGYGPTLLQSDQGIVWSTALVPASASNTVFLGIGGRPDRLVAVGSAGQIARSPSAYEPLVVTNWFTNGPTVLTAVVTNQLNTLALAWFNSPSGVTQDLQGIAANDSQFVASGANGTILTSPDALAWTRQVTPTTRFLSSVASVPSGWIAVGESGTILRSPDGIGWAPKNSGTTRWLWRVAYFNGLFLASGESGTVLTSTNGDQWTPASTGVTNWLYDVESIQGTYYAAGSQGTLLTSTDAATWQPADTLTAKSLYGLASHSGRLIAIGSEGVILRAQAGPFPSPPAISKWPVTPTNQLFLVNGHLDQRFSLERSEDLILWSSESEVEITSPDGSALLFSHSPNGTDRQYFRAAERE